MAVDFLEYARQLQQDQQARTAAMGNPFDGALSGFQQGYGVGKGVYDDQASRQDANAKFFQDQALSAMRQGDMQGAAGYANQTQGIYAQRHPGYTPQDLMTHTQVVDPSYQAPQQPIPTTQGTPGMGQMGMGMQPGALSSQPDFGQSTGNPFDAISQQTPAPAPMIDQSTPNLQALRAVTGYVPQISSDEIAPGGMRIIRDAQGNVINTITNRKTWNNLTKLQDGSIYDNETKQLVKGPDPVMDAQAEWRKAQAAQVGNGGPVRTGTWQISPDGLHKMNTETGEVVALDQGVGAKNPTAGGVTKPAKPAMTESQISAEAARRASKDPANFTLDKMGNRVPTAGYNAAYMVQREAVKKEQGAQPAGDADKKAAQIKALVSYFAGKQ